jgi:cytochrome c553
MRSIDRKHQSVKAQMMKFVRSKMVVLAIVASAVPALAGDVETGGVRNCIWCHGTGGQGFTIAPRLAGQRHQYIENQLLDFSRHTRDNPFSKQYMWGAAANLNTRTARDLAMYFSTLPPKAANDGVGELAATGRALYEDGDPDANIAACAVCHGPNAQGIRGIPRLGGLSYAYLKRKLKQWNEGYHAAAEPPMPFVASTLSPNEIEALASYLSFVK